MRLRSKVRSKATESPHFKLDVETFNLNQTFLRNSLYASFGKRLNISVALSQFTIIQLPFEKFFKSQMQELYLEEAYKELNARSKCKEKEHVAHRARRLAKLAMPTF